MYCPICKKVWKNSNLALECCIIDVDFWLLERLKDRFYKYKNEIDELCEDKPKGVIHGKKQSI